jgi:hypothetical protein
MSQSIEDMKRELREAAQREIDARQRVAILAQLIADATCPLRVGQVVPVCGYSHNGKQMRVERVGYTRSTYDGDWRVSGRVLKQDGSDSKLTADFSQHNWETHTKKTAEQAGA